MYIPGYQYLGSTTKANNVCNFWTLKLNLEIFTVSFLKYFLFIEKKKNNDDIDNNTGYSG